MDFAQAPVLAIGSGGRLAKTTAYAVTASDSGRIIDCTTGTFTVTLLAAATAGNGFIITIRNSGAGVITVSSASQIEVNGFFGSTSLTLLGGQSLTLLCDSNFYRALVASPGAIGGPVVVLSGTTSLGLAEAGRTVLCQNASFTVTLPNSISKAGYCIVNQSSAASPFTITVSAFGVNNITAWGFSVSSFTIAPGQSVFIHTDGNGSWAIGLEGLGIYRFANTVTTYTGSQTLSATTHKYVRYTGTTGSTFTLPAANVLGAGFGWNLRVRHLGSGNLLISAAGSDTIETATGVTLIAGQFVELMSDGVSAIEAN